MEKKQMIEKKDKPFGPKKQHDNDRESNGFEEKVIEVSRVSRTVKGGKRIRFRALVVVGNRNGKVGMGIGKAQEVMVAVQKASRKAKKNMVDVPIVNGTIPHEIKINYGSSIIFFKPAKTGTSIIAGGSVRPVIELSGIKNILTKIIGSPNKINNVTATLLAFKQMRKPETKSDEKTEVESQKSNKETEIKGSK